MVLMQALGYGSSHPPRAAKDFVSLGTNLTSSTRPQGVSMLCGMRLVACTCHSLTGVCHGMMGATLWNWLIVAESRK